MAVLIETNLGDLVIDLKVWRSATIGGLLKGGSSAESILELPEVARLS